MSESLNQLKQRVAQLSRLNQIAALLDWDQQTNMPPGGAESRSEHAATLSEIRHELGTSDALGNLLTQAEADLEGADPDDDDVRMLARLRRDYEKETKLPTALVTEMARHLALSQETWVLARQKSDFEAFAPSLEKTLDLTRQQAEYLGYKEHLYDALVDLFEPGATYADMAAMFGELKPGLLALTRAIAESSNPVDDSLLHGDFSIAKQRTVTLEIAAALGYDTRRGRQDEAAHPFCTNFSRDDVRITTRYNTKILSEALYASIHETGHALYEQGSPAHFEATTLAGGTSSGVHESQSRLWENLVGRSRPFSQWVYPRLQQVFPDAFARGDAEAYYRAVNKVEPSFIRVEADEVTYNMHVLLRFELETALLTGQLAVQDLPDAWDAKMQEYLGITPHTDAVGCLQDVHWSAGLIGYFPTYSVGNLLSAQLWARINEAIPELNEQMAQGHFGELLDWLRENVHSFGSKYLPKELILRATGEPLTARYYVDYLSAKYGDIYSL